jgi:hypothetical protein
MNPGNGAWVYNNVTFSFFHPDKYQNDYHLPGSVRSRADEMVLDIPGGDGPYLVKGSANKHWFEGPNADRHGTKMKANWADIGIKWVGIWHEGGDEFHFSFILNQKTARFVPDDE